MGNKRNRNKNVDWKDINKLYVELKRSIEILKESITSIDSFVRKSIPNISQEYNILINGFNNDTGLLLNNLVDVRNQHSIKEGIINEDNEEDYSLYLKLAVDYNELKDKIFSVLEPYRGGIQVAIQNMLTNKTNDSNTNSETTDRVLEGELMDD